MNAPYIPFPMSMKFILLCRHFANTQNLFLGWEARVLRRIHKKYANRSKGQILKPIEYTRSDFDPSIIKNMGRRTTYPIIVRGFTDPDKLTLEVLENEYGEATVPVHPKADLTPDAVYENVKVRKLKDLLSDMRQGKAVYSVAAADIFRQFKELPARIGSKDIENVAKVDVIKNEFFIGGGNVGSNYHCAPADNYFLMVTGQKTWRLIDPRNSMALYPTIGRAREAASRNSPITHKTYDPAKYPLYEKIDIMEVTLNPGDLLYNPTMWWHEVENHGFTIGAPHRVAPRPRYDLLGLTMILRASTVRYFWDAIFKKRHTKANENSQNDDSQVMKTYGGSGKLS